MKVSIFGIGYVGLVTGACLAEVGHDVMCVDVDDRRVENLKKGVLPIHEPGLEPVVSRNYQAGRLHFTTDAEQAVKHGDIQMIAVGTPPDEDGSADLQYVLKVAETIARYMDRRLIVVTKSTVPVGTADKVKSAVNRVLQERGLDMAFSVVSNPEFLKEGDAVNDFMRPERIIIGTDNPEIEEMLRELYAPFNRSHERTVFMDVRSAELTKYAANAMLATKISFMNEVANIAEKVGADIEMIRRGIGSDPRIGYHFIYPGCGYGGSCFPKDVKALARTAKEIGYESELLNAVENVNDRQKYRLFDLISRYYGGESNLAGKTFALWGLAFKPNTDDMREAPSRNLMEALWAAGAKVQAYDPIAMEETQRIYGVREELVLTGTKEECLRNADALMICTEWKSFWAPDFGQMKTLLRDPVIFDGRNLYDPISLSKQGWAYYAIGRGESVAKFS